MKTTLILAACLVLTGCGSLSNRVSSAIPEGSWATVDATVTGKFSSTQINGKNVVKKGDVLTAGDLHIRHSNAWVPLIEIDAKGFAP